MMFGESSQQQQQLQQPPLPGPPPHRMQQAPPPHMHPPSLYRNQHLPPPPQHQQPPPVMDFPRGPPPPPTMMRPPSVSSTNLPPQPEFHHPHQPPFDSHADSYAIKRMRKLTQRRAVDYTSTIVRYIQVRMWQRGSRDRTILQPTPAAAVDLLPPVAYSDNPSTSFAAKFVHTSLNKNRCSINRVLDVYK